MKPYLNEVYNITADNVIISLRLAEKLKLMKACIVGTANRGRKTILKISKNEKIVLYKYRMFAKDNIILTVYQEKNNENVLILSFLHSLITLGTDEKHLPETVKFGNSTTFGVDLLDQMTRKYSTKAYYSRR